MAGLLAVVIVGRLFMATALGEAFGSFDSSRGWIAARTSQRL